MITGNWAEAGGEPMSVIRKCCDAIIVGLAQLLQT